MQNTDIMSDILNDFATKINCFEAVFVDLDGTLVDTDVANTQAYLSALAELSVPIDLSQYMGERITKDTLKRHGLSHSLIEKIARKKADIYPTLLHQTRINKTLLETVKNHYQLCEFYIVSSGASERVCQTMIYHNLRYLFKDIICISQEKYLYVINILNINIDKIFIFDDDEKEIIHAISLGIPRNHIYLVNGDLFNAK